MHYYPSSPPSDCIRVNSAGYQLVKYPPEKKHNPEYHFFRSVIYKNNKVCCFSPPKSILLETFKTQFPIEQVVVESFIDGTMINVFFDEEDQWKISTKSVLDAKCTFESETTFAELFEECLRREQLSFHHLDPSCCYSFVMQHPKNSIVIQVEEPKLFLVAVYKILADAVYEQEIPFLAPPRFSFSSYEEAHHTIQNIVCKGCMLKCSGVRAKIRNESYNTMSQIKGNTPFEYKYLGIRKKEEAELHFTYFPKDRERSIQIEQKISECVLRLLEDYKACFIHKRIAHRDLTTKTYLYDLHGIYMNELKPRGLHKKRVIEYVDALPPARLATLLKLKI
uniref:Uncharacterized protein n=1 Tax=viral metagenome TaxID=1070528 RepID=A0A6C0AGV5_9ZZZZ